MKGPTPKPPTLRQRRNRVATRAVLTLSSARTRRTPPLPDGRDWHPLSVAYWRSIWRSPMAGEYLDVDVGGLYLLMDLVDRYWTEPSTRLASEIRQQRAEFGVTPISRRRLQWEVERAESVTRKRTRPEADGDDPRSLWRAVK